MATYHGITEIIADQHGITKLFQNLDPSKACGPDNIPTVVLKTCADKVAPTKYIGTGTLPTDWLKASVSCVFKKGDRNLAKNYRPISLTFVSCKLLEHIICRHLMSHLQYRKILTHLNHGFRSGFSC